MCRSMVDIQSATDEIRRGKKEERKKQDKNIMSASATHGGHIMTMDKQCMQRLTAPSLKQCVVSHTYKLSLNKQIIKYHINN